MTGLVIKNTGSHYIVLTEDGVERSCLAKGNLRLRGFRSTNPIVVGDHVEVTLSEGQGEEEAHYIRDILPRKNYIIRRAANLSKESHILAANIDASLLICTVAAPETSTTFIDRFLATAEAYRVPTELVFNKIDLYPPEATEYMEELIQLYTSIGYPCHRVSATTGEGVGDLIDHLKGKITLFSGHSGVGKSTLINQLIPGVELRTGAISLAHFKGMHTTTFSQMIPLPYAEGGYLIDTPGIKGFGMLEMDEAEVSHYFPELFEISKACRFGNCTHTHEPGCAVREAVDEGRIAPSRYVSYLGILEDKEGGKYRPEYK
nr:ribosome small subunit-dependent GTPase A [uncultured Porphyromonas sp.]